MAKKKDSDDRIKIFEKDQIDKIDWEKESAYDFFATPKEVRDVLISRYLEWRWEHFRRDLHDRYRKSISQNNYAEKTVGIDAQLFSLYKSGSRFPTPQNADILAAYYGPIIWDICGYSRRMPKNRELYEMADDWLKLSERARSEILERKRNLLDNGDINLDNKDEPKDVYF